MLVVKERKDGRPLTTAQQRKAAALPQPAKLAPPAVKPVPKPRLTTEQLRRQAEAKRDAAQIHSERTKPNGAVWRPKRAQNQVRHPD